VRAEDRFRYIPKGGNYVLRKRAVREDKKDMAAATLPSPTLELLQQRVREEEGLPEIDRDILIDVIEGMIDKNLPENQIVGWIETSIEIRKSSASEREETKREVQRVFSK
jgi:hypothetical protein